MVADSIIDEVRKAREAIAREHGDEVPAVVDALRRKEAEDASRVVSLPPRPSSRPRTGRKAG